MMSEFPMNNTGYYTTPVKTSHHQRKQLYDVNELLRSLQTTSGGKYIMGVDNLRKLAIPQDQPENNTGDPSMVNL